MVPPVVVVTCWGDEASLEPEEALAAFDLKAAQEISRRDVTRIPAQEISRRDVTRIPDGSRVVAVAELRSHTRSR